MSEIHIPSPQTYRIASLELQRPEIIPLILDAATAMISSEVPPEDFYVANKMYWRNSRIDQTGQVTNVVSGMLGAAFFGERNVSGLEAYPITVKGKTQSNRDFQITSFAVHGLRTYNAYQDGEDLIKQVETASFTNHEAEAHIGVIVARVNVELGILNSPYRLPEYQ